MTFEDLWREIEKVGALPEAAILEIPKVLSCEIKAQLSEMNSKDAARMIADVIEEINSGNVKRIEELLRERLQAK